MEWFLIYLLVMCESIAALFAGMGFLFVIGIIMITGSTSIAGINASDLEEFSGSLSQPMIKRVRRWGISLFIMGLVMTGVAKLIPTQKDLAIIIGAGVTYQAVTSETGKRIGGKAIELLEQKIDSALKDKVTESVKGKAL